MQAPLHSRRQIEKRGAKAYNNVMAKRPEKDSRAAGLVALCCAVYFTSYLTRKGYDASILAICESTGLARTAAGLASTAAVVAYGSGQFVAGLLADRLDPRRIILGALLLTAMCNVAMPFAAGAACIPAMMAFWALNGFSQAMFWPPMVKIVSANLTPERFKGAVYAITIASEAAIIGVFLLVSGCIRFAGWRLSFAVAAVAALVMAILWATVIRRLAPGEVCNPTRGVRQEGGTKGALPLSRLLIVSGLLTVMAAIACQGVMRDGIEVWAPSIVKDLYGLDTSSSVFVVVLLPIFAVASLTVARAIRRALGDEIKAAVTLFAVGLGCAAILFATGGATLAVGLPLLAVISACMHGINLVLIAELPGRFAQHGRVGTISGILNACTYIGSAISIYGFAALHAHFAGWRPVFALWIGVLALGIIACLLALRRWRIFKP